MPKRYALISTSDKSQLAPFAKALHEHDITLLATGGTARHLTEHDIPVVEIADFTGFPEILDGRVKTLHPTIHAGILARRGIDDETLAAHDIAHIDFVVVNLYPFERTIAQPDCTDAQAIEQIDVGGPTMLRAGAKNHDAVTVIVDPADYALVLSELQAQGHTSPATRRALAHKTFALTAAYDQAIAAYFHRTASTQTPFPDTWDCRANKLDTLRYGENPHQRAAVYQMTNAAPGTLTHATQHQGKPLSYNNYLDSDAALHCVRALPQDLPACVIIKHATPCGVAVGATLTEAYQKAFSTDSTSAFGGIIAVNQTLDAQTAEAMVSQQFIEVLLAPRFTPEALAVLARKTNLRALSCGDPTPSSENEMSLRSISGGLLIQEADHSTLTQADCTVVTRAAPTPAQWHDLLLAWRVVQFVKSNAIVYLKEGMTLGIGSGQTSRVFSAHIATLKAEAAGLSLEAAVMASDAFFPFSDGLQVAIDAGVTAVIQPGGSKRDDEVIAAADAAGIAMVLTHVRHFRH